VGDDSSNLNSYFELGWEVVGSRMDFIAKLNQGLIDTNDTTAVSIEDRTFMYKKFFKNVISYEHFSSLSLGDGDSVDDWTHWTHPYPFPRFKFYDSQSFINQKTREYIRLEEDRELLFDGYELNDRFEIPLSYFIICMRFRDHCSYRSSDIGFYTLLVEELKKIEDNIFIVGRGAQEFCAQNNCTYIGKLQDYVTLIKGNKCTAIVAQSTGTALLSFMSAVSPVFLIDDSRVSDIDGDNAVLGGRCVQICENIYPYYEANAKTIKSIVSKILDVPATKTSFAEKS